MPKALAQELISALVNLDSQLTGLGLYASNEYQMEKSGRRPYLQVEWNMAMCPRLEALGYTVPKSLPSCRWVHRDKVEVLVQIMSPDGTNCDLFLLRTSVIKVRRFGSGYQMDRHVDHQKRWDELNMDSVVARLWSPAGNRPSYAYQKTSENRVVLFLGFDKAERPFHAELTRLEKQLRWSKHGVEFLTKSWLDPYGRNFNNLIACWTYSHTSDTPS
ncbi:MAG: hypothetical protein ACAI35_02415 [Candidatus Methylacidiphilales bacterium]|nr:hypothetical protein [Candidatus Methylacidiphilales bacterium]